MANLIDKLTGLGVPRAQPAQPPLPGKAPAVQERLDTAEALLATYGQEYGQAALAVTLEQPDSAARFAAVKAKCAEAREQIALLKAALEAAQQADAAQLRKEQARLHQQQIINTKRELGRRDEAAAKVSRGIALATEGWRDLLKATEKAGWAAKAALGGKSIMGAGFSLTEMRLLVEAEIWRLGVTFDPRDLSCKMAFPGGRPDHVNHRLNPGAITPLADVVKQKSDYVINIVEGRAPLASPAVEETPAEEAKEVVE